jgi:hypothetical protein
MRIQRKSLGWSQTLGRSQSWRRRPPMPTPMSLRKKRTTPSPKLTTTLLRIGRVGAKGESQPLGKGSPTSARQQQAEMAATLILFPAQKRSRGCYRGRLAEHGSPTSATNSSSSRLHSTWRLSKSIQPVELRISKRPRRSSTLSVASRTSLRWIGLCGSRRPVPTSSGRRGCWRRS